MGELAAYRRNTYSQNGEDGVIEEIFRRLKVSQGWFCEFGAWDGRYGSNCYKLLRKGWNGVMIEGDHERYGRLMELGRRFPKLVTIEAYVSHDWTSEKCLDALLATTPIPKDFELLSIDIDGFDYQVWEAFVHFRPRLVIIEINSRIPPGAHAIHGSSQSGSSFSAMLGLGISKGYTLVAHTGNMFFVRSDLVEQLLLPSEDIRTPESLFVSSWVNPTRFQVFVRKLGFMTPQRAAIKIDNWLRDRRWHQR